MFIENLFLFILFVTDGYRGHGMGRSKVYDKKGPLEEHSTTGCRITRCYFYSTTPASSK